MTCEKYVCVAMTMGCIEMQQQWTWVTPEQRALHTQHNLHKVSSVCTGGNKVDFIGTSEKLCRYYIDI